MLRMKGKSLKEQEAIVKKNPDLILTTGRPVDFTKPAVPAREKHPGLRPAGQPKAKKEKASDTGAKKKVE